MHCISRVKDYQPEPIVREKTKPNENMVKEFLDTITSWVHKIHKKFENPRELNMTAKEKCIYEESNNCWIRKKEFYKKAPWKEWKVRDHDHFTGKFRGAAHNICNLRIQNRKVIPVIAHNLSKYDLKRDLMKYTDGDPNVIAKSSEEFITVSIKIWVGYGYKGRGIYYTSRFTDSLKFLSAPLDKLVENSELGCNDPSENFPILKKYYPKKYSLLLRKGVYPYEYFTDFSKMLEKELPPKEAFYSQLRFSGITDEEYEHAQNVYFVKI